MAHKHPHLFWLSCLLTLPAWALSLHDAPIQKVTIYRNGAMVERQVPIQQGQTSLTFDAMPANFNIEQMQIGASNGIVVGNVNATDSHERNVLGARAQGLQKRIEALEAEIADLDIDIKAAQMQTAYLNNMQASVNQSESVRLQARNAYRIIHNAEQKKSRLSLDLNNAKANLSRQGGQNLQTRRLDVQLSAARSGTVTLRYVVGNASWRPFYRASLNSQRAEVTIERMAMVQQQSGEDWQNVDLVLSSDTARSPSAQNQPQPWYLDVTPPPSARRYDAPAPVAAASRLGFLGAEDLGSGLTNLWQVAAVDLPYGISYQANQATSVYSSSEETMVPLDKVPFPVRLGVQVAPRLETTAVVTATLPQLDGVWLTGEAKLFRDGSYVGQSILQQDQLTPPTLAFGEDARISVEVSNKVGENKSAFGKRSVKTTHETYTIQNNHPSAVDLVVLAPIPTSRHKDVKAQSRFSIEPTAKSWQNLDHVYQWQQVLPSKGRFTLDLSHEFTYPDDANVTGLPQ